MVIIFLFNKSSDWLLYLYCLSGRVVGHLFIGYQIVIVLQKCLQDSKSVLLACKNFVVKTLIFLIPFMKN
ncbi:hypothetical protein DERP_004236 [Dermatophagoides pteronyssinus]|uniref:Uncharacterized protein n=1 Tax=Dermatophagoides pteronyssinus TaxID=6956 RepID=A0ABQ8J8N8_DERPT|nr:hypothetical protein DERP_004236 [Dermatophagoides pteronyssinus]